LPTWRRSSPECKPGARVVIIGGGYIGLETAATCRKLGCEVTVLEMADRVMNRVVAPSVSQFFAQEHRAHGVNLICDARVVGLEGRGRVQRVVCADGNHHQADLLIVGVGCIASTRLASDAGLACDNGILVDEYCRTSDAAIFAAGDCTNHPSPHFGRRIRLESVDNAFEQAKTAALNLLDRNVGARPRALVLVGSVRQQVADHRPVAGPRSDRCCAAIRRRAASACAI
jgi:3-phenylpropionate/trans-cinnamate dioxygenase ferredoxin reductase subunit